ncbi:hypothetical protein J5Y03_03135 [Bacillus sp. RG28]|uniref:Uncharacterized protein n=1 Tax=Gottfriedia endophytica TaxID=2820819 RepID=A0A940SHP8_9BACI|nr:hypothetical protein [Gottfriedia endophytica]MBP0724175.1 hypothetical protein [Gottfriedia endophytica]
MDMIQKDSICNVIDELLNEIELIEHTLSLKVNQKIVNENSTLLQQIQLTTMHLHHFEKKINQVNDGGNWIRTPINLGKLAF